MKLSDRIHRMRLHTLAGEVALLEDVAEAAKKWQSKGRKKRGPEAWALIDALAKLDESSVASRDES